PRGGGRARPAAAPASGHRPRPAVGCAYIRLRRAVMRRPISATLKVVAVGFVLAVAGCAPVPTGIVYQPAAETSDEQARSELLAAFGAQYGVPISMEMVMGDVLTMTGSTDPTNGAAHMSMSIQDGMMRLNMEVIVIVPDMWMNMGEAGPMLGLETPW